MPGNGAYKLRAGTAITGDSVGISGEAPSCAGGRCMGVDARNLSDRQLTRYERRKTNQPSASHTLRGGRTIRLRGDTHTRAISG